MYATFTSGQLSNTDKYLTENSPYLGNLLANFSFNYVSPVVTAGISGATVTTYFFVAPCNGVVTRAWTILHVAQTGTSNTPQITLQDGANILASVTIQLSQTVGKAFVMAMNATAANLVFKAGDVLKVLVINTSGTITIPIQVSVQMEWNATA